MNDFNKRLKELNRSKCIPFAFRLYAYYEVPRRLADKKLHQMIVRLNPNLRSIEEFDGKTRKREFYNMSVLPIGKNYIAFISFDLKFLKMSESSKEENRNVDISKVNKKEIRFYNLCRVFPCR